MLIKFLLYATLFVGGLPDAGAASISETYVCSKDAMLFCRSVGDGLPLIVIHGGPGLSQDYLLPQMYELGKSNLVIFYDQRGCGKSTGEINGDTIESFMNDIEAIRKAFECDKISLLGHSWGGFLAMHYAIRNQEHVDKLILSNSAPATSEGYALFNQEFANRMKPYQENLNKIGSLQGFREGDPDLMEQFYRLIFRQYCYNPDKADLLNLRMISIAHLNGAKVSEIIRKNVLDHPFNLNCSLNGLKIPVLVLHGDVDPIPTPLAKAIHENIPNSKFVLMKNCGHFPYVEDPAPYFKDINDFLNAIN